MAAIESLTSDRKKGLTVISSAQTATISPCPPSVPPNSRGEVGREAGSACIKRPRWAINFKPSSRLKTPAIHAATYSPTLCPITTSGLIPHENQTWAKAYSKANKAGCV